MDPLMVSIPGGLGYIYIYINTQYIQSYPAGGFNPIETY